MIEEVPCSDRGGKEGALGEGIGWTAARGVLTRNAHVRRTFDSADLCVAYLKKHVIISMVAGMFEDIPRTETCAAARGQHPRPIARGVLKQNAFTC